jgi:hypothetical protein
VHHRGEREHDRRQAVPDDGPATAAAEIGDGEDQPRARQRQREAGRVPGERVVGLGGGDRAGHGAGQADDAADRAAVVAPAVVEDHEADPGPPERDEDAERGEDPAPSGVGHHLVRDLTDREDEDQVEVQLHPGDPLALGTRPLIFHHPAIVTVHDWC